MTVMDKNIFQELNKKLNKNNEDEKVKSIIDSINQIIDEIDNKHRNILYLEKEIKKADSDYSCLEEEHKKLITNRDKLLLMVANLNKTLNRINSVINLVKNMKIEETNIDLSHINKNKMEMQKIDSALNRFPKSQRTKVNNVIGDTLEFLQDTLDGLDNLKKFDEISELISEVNEVDWKKCEKKIWDASYYYSLITDNQKEFVNKTKKYNKLLLMMKNLEQEMAKNPDKYKKQTDNVCKLIEALACDYGEDQGKYIKYLNKAKTAYMNLPKIRQNEIDSREVILNGLDWLDTQNKIIENLIEIIDKKIPLDDEDKKDIENYRSWYENSTEQVENVNSLFDKLYNSFNDLVKNIQIGIDKNNDNENQKNIDEAITIYNLLPKTIKDSKENKSKFEDLQNYKKIVNVNDSIQEILDGQFENIDGDVKEVKENYNKLNKEQQCKVSNYNELLDYESKVKERNKKEKEIEKHKDELNKIKEPLKNLEKFESEHPKDFNEEFNNQLLKGLDLCLKYDDTLSKCCNIDNIKECLKNDKIDVLNNICKEKWITFVSRNYLLFIINMIEYKKLYLEDSKNNEIDYKDPHWKDDKLDEFDEFEQKWKEEKSVDDKAKLLINALFDQISDSSMTLENLQSIYAYLNGEEYSITEKRHLKKVWDKPDYHNRIIEEIINKFKDSTKTQGQKACYDALGVLQRIELKKDSNLKKCDIPVWNIKDNKPSLSTEDLKQGTIGDCWLISALISIVKDNPENILKCFPNRDQEIDESGSLSGDYITVRLYKVMLTVHRKKDKRLRAYARPIRPIKIKMSTTIYEQGNKTKVAWPKFIEKATSVYRAKKMLELATIDSPLGKLEEKWLNEIKILWQGNSEIAGYHNLEGSPADGIVKAMLLGTTGGGSIKIPWEKKFKIIDFENYLRNNLKKFKQKNAGISFIDDFEIDENNCIEKNHVYSITNVDDNNVYLINPHDGEIEIKVPIDIFCEHCRDISFGHSSSY